jgi:hypothetical protein
MWLLIDISLDISGDDDQPHPIVGNIPQVEVQLSLPFVPFPFSTEFFDF